MSDRRSVDSGDSSAAMTRGVDGRMWMRVIQLYVLDQDGGFLGIRDPKGPKKNCWFPIEGVMPPGVNPTKAAFSLAHRSAALRHAPVIRVLGGAFPLSGTPYAAEDQGPPSYEKGTTPQGDDTRVTFRFEYPDGPVKGIAGMELQPFLMSVQSNEKMFTVEDVSPETGILTTLVAKYVPLSCFYLFTAPERRSAAEHVVASIFQLTMRRIKRNESGIPTQILDQRHVARSSFFVGLANKLGLVMGDDYILRPQATIPDNTPHPEAAGARASRRYSSQEPVAEAQPTREESEHEQLPSYKDAVKEAATSAPKEEEKPSGKPVGVRATNGKLWERKVTIFIVNKEGRFLTFNDFSETHEEVLPSLLSVQQVWEKTPKDSADLVIGEHFLRDCCYYAGKVVPSFEESRSCQANRDGELVTDTYASFRQEGGGTMLRGASGKETFPVLYYFPQRQETDNANIFQKSLSASPMGARAEWLSLPEILQEAVPAVRHVTENVLTGVFERCKEYEKALPLSDVLNVVHPRGPVPKRVDRKDLEPVSSGQFSSANDKGGDTHSASFNPLPQDGPSSSPNTLAHDGLENADELELLMQRQTAPRRRVGPPRPGKR